MSPEQMSLFRGKLYNTAKLQHGGVREASAQNELLGSTAQRLAGQYGVSRETIKRDGKFADSVEVLGLDLDITSGRSSAPKFVITEVAKPIIEANKAHAEWAKRSKEKITTESEPPKPTEEDIKKARAHVANNSGDNEWYTPSEYTEMARSVMGSIDLDPASCTVANESVKAKSYYDVETDGLKQKWSGNVWMNPPYAQPLIRHFCEKLVEEYQKGNITQAVVLVNNATETKWFQGLTEEASAMCLLSSRIKFWAPGKSTSAPLQGQAIIYFGDKQEDFRNKFDKYGKCSVFTRLQDSQLENLNGFEIPFQQDGTAQELVRQRNFLLNNVSSFIATWNE